MLLSACAGTRPGGDGATADKVSGCRYAVYEGEGWKLLEAVDYPVRYINPADPGLDWYAEYERSMPSAGGGVNVTSLRISGHDLGSDDLRGRLAGIDWREQAPPAGLFVGSATGGPSSVVAKPIGDIYTLAFLSYGLSIDELVQITSDTRSVCQQEWTAAGGTILDCLPTEPGCATDAQ